MIECTVPIAHAGEFVDCQQLKVGRHARCYCRVGFNDDTTWNIRTFKLIDSFSKFGQIFFLLFFTEDIGHFTVVLIENFWYILGAKNLVFCLDYIYIMREESTLYSTSQRYIEIESRVSGGGRQFDQWKRISGGGGWNGGASWELTWSRSFCKQMERLKNHFEGEVI